MEKFKLPDSIKNLPLSKELKIIIEKGAKYARIDKEPEVRTAHIVFAILADDFDNIILSTLDAMKVDRNILYEMVSELRRLSDEEYEGTITLSKEIENIIVSNQIKKKSFEKEYSVVDFFISLLKIKNELTDVFFENAISYEVFVDTYKDVNEFFSTINEASNVHSFENTQESTNQNQQINKKLEDFLVNFNDEFIAGHLNNCIGREEELLTIERVLNRKNKRNILLIGKAGVGKTNIIEGLVEKIINKRTSHYLKDKIVLALNVNDLISGTIWRGQLEEKIKNLITFLRTNPNYILFIDEIHTIINNGGMDLANTLKPFLARGELQVIGATTPEEYKTSIERDRAFNRRFHILQIEEPYKADTINILKQVRTTYEKLHGVKYDDEIIELIYSISEKYNPNLNFPDKGIELLDDIGSFIKINRKKNSATIDKLNEKLKNIQQKKNKLFQLKEYEQSEKLLIAEKQVLSLLKDELKIMNEETSSYVITKEDVLDFTSKLYNIKSFQKISKDTKYFENSLQSILSQIQQQDQIVKTILNKIETKFLFDGLDIEEEPLVFAFVGESGVGKTFLAKLLAKELYDDKIKILNGELFKERHSVANLIGSPKGYVGSESGSDLFEWVKNNPSEGIIVFDEIEKAHPDFYDALLSIIDKGKISDKDGLIIDFSKKIIIFTSNIGAEKVKNFTPIGFNINKNETSQRIIESELTRRFKPEFLNRIDEIFYFNNIENMEETLLKEFDKIVKFLSDKNIHVKLSEETKKSLLDSNIKNVRELKRQINKLIKDKIVRQYKTSAEVLV